MEFRFGVENLDTGKNYGKVGLVTNATGITTGLQQNVDFLVRKGVNIVKIFSPEHGFYSTFAPGEDVPDEIYNGIPVKSLYTEESKDVDKNELSELDTVIYDLQDAGVRFYTYLSTLHNLLKASKDVDAKVIVLDRPNPARSDIIEGPLLDEKYISFVGTDIIPTRYGMTIGELSLYLGRNLGLDHEVVKMSGYRRNAYYDDLVQFYVPFSWNLPNMDSVINYIGMCIFEAANVSIGRGTPYPFMQIGFPHMWDHINGQWDGITLRKTEFKPLTNHWKDERVQGYFVHITDRAKYSPLKTWIEVFYRLYLSEKVDINEKWMHLIYGSDGLDKIKAGSMQFSELFQSWDQDISNFRETRSHYLLY